MADREHAPFETLDSRRQVTRLRALAIAALPRFGMDAAAHDRLRLISHRENTTFRLDGDGARFVVRIHRATGSPAHPVRTPDDVRSEMDWLVALRRDTSLPVPEPVETSDGELVVVQSAAGVPQPRTCVLLRWVDGRFVDRRLTPAHLERVGRFIATLHEHAAAWAPPAGFRRHRLGDLTATAAEAMVAQASEIGRPEDVATTRAVIERARAAQRALDEEPGTSLLIHGDLHQENYLFDGGTVGAIDFDDCGFGHIAYDLSVPLFELSLRPAFDALRAALLAGYRSVRPFSLEHERHVETFQALRTLQVTLWLIERRNEPAFADWEREVRAGFDALAAATPH